MFKFKLEKDFNKNEGLDYIKDCEIQYKDGYLFFITYSNDSYYEGLLLIEKSNGLIEAIPSEFIVDELHNIKGHKKINSKVALEIFDIFLNFNEISNLDISSVKTIHHMSTERGLEYKNNKLIRKLSDNLVIKYILYINDYSLTAKGYLLDIENNKKLTEDIFQFECSGTYSYEDLEYLFEIFHPNDLNEYIVN